MFSEELEEELVSRLMEMGPLEEDVRSKMSKQWLAGIKKGWKAQLKTMQGKKGPMDASEIDFALIHKASDKVLPALRETLSWIRAFRADLNINKGFWGGSSQQKKGAGNYSHNVKAKIQELLDAAEEVIKRKMSGVTNIAKLMDTTSREYEFDGGSMRNYAGQSLKDFNFHLNAISLALDEAAKEADAIVSRKLFRHLNTYLGNHDSVDFGGYEPQVVKLGKVTVVFEDGPADVDSPASKRARLRKGIDGFSRQTGPRHPGYREKYIKALLKTQALLKRRGLEHLWYGRVVIMCKECGGKSQHGDKYGSVGAHYHRKGDWVSVYSNPDNTWIPYLMAHELGHRHYFKFMSARDRGQFDQWFKKVKPVSDYGGTVSEEDFAEVFAHYVDGKNLTGDQMGRLRAFLGRGKKLESVGEEDRIKWSWKGYSRWSGDPA